MPNANLYQHTNLGMSAYIEWQTLDIILQRWANQNFSPDKQSGPRMAAGRDDLSVLLDVYELTNDDIPAWKNLFDKYDKERDWDAMEEFRTGITTAIIPGDMSRRIICEAVHTYTAIGFKPTALIANEYGVCFFEMAPKGFSNYFSAEEEA